MNPINQRPSLRQIEAFLAVAEAGSFSSAARRVGSTQPALSQAVRDLEDALGLSLFARTTRRVDLTDEGIALRERLSNGMAILDDAFSRSRDVAALRSGHLKIAAPPLLAATVLPPLIASFAAVHPGLTFDLADVVSADIPRRVRSGLADVGIGTFGPTEQGIDRRLLLTDTMSLICPKGHALARQSLCWDDLKGHSVIGLDHGSNLRLLADVGLQSAGLDTAPRMVVRQVATALSLVEAGLGIAIFPSYVIKGREDRLACIPLDQPRLLREIVIISAPDRVHPPAVTALVRHLITAFASAYRRPEI